MTIPMCSTCYFGHEPQEAPFDRVICKRYPPKMHIIPARGLQHKLFFQSSVLSTFPSVDFSEWCGEWRDVETASKEGADIDEGIDG